MNSGKSLVGIALIAVVAFPVIARAEGTVANPTNTSISSSQFHSDVAGDVTGDDVEETQTISANYFALFYGPGVQGGNFDYQPSPTGGGSDPTRPVTLKNFLGVSYNLTDKLAITPTAYWTYQPAAIGSPFVMRDPFIRFSDSSVFFADGLNLYSDVRVHMPVTSYSRSLDLRSGFQTVHALNYMFPESRFSAGLYGSARYNVFGPQGVGNDVELYLGPNVSYQLTPALAITTLYEMNAAHVYGSSGSLVSDGTDLQPGVSWDITKEVNFNPYLNFNTGGNLGLAETSVGAMLSVKLL
jgi:hypothetical protein